MAPSRRTPVATTAEPRRPWRDVAAAASYRPSYLAAALTALAIFVLYVVTLAPSTAMWDTSEYIAAAYVLGLPHPPGNPFFVLLAHAFGLLPLAHNYAARINLLAALSSALSAGLWFLVTERVVATWLPRRWQQIVAAVLGAVIGAITFTVWHQSVVMEKVYTISLLFIAVISWLMLRWIGQPDSPRSDRILVLVAYLLGLGYAVHPAGFLALPAVGVAVLVRRWQTVLRWRLMLAAVLALVLGLTPFVAEPIRSAHFPPLNEGEPTGCARKIGFSCTLSGLTWDRLMANINRSQYAKPSVLKRQVPITAQVGMWWLYFKWQWLRDVHGAHPTAQTILAVVFFLLGLLGGYEHWKRDRSGFWYFGPLVFTLTLALIYYLNFKLGYSQALARGGNIDFSITEPRDRDYFYLWSFSTWGVWAALGLVAVWRWLADLFGARGAEGAGTRAAAPSARPWLLASPVLAIVLVPLLGNWHAASRAGQTFTRDWAADLLNSVEPYGILITNGDNDTFPLWYAQDVEGIRPDVLVAVTSYLDMDWFGRQIIRRPVATYDAAKGPAIYRGKTWKKPEGPPLKMSFAQADSIPPYIVLRQAQQFHDGGITATIQPGLLERNEIVTLRFILDAFPQRPIYFAASAFPERLGLGKYLLRQGLVEKLEPEAVQSSADTLMTADGHFDLPRTEALWNSVYRGPEALLRQGDWVDPASHSSPMSYSIVGAMLSQALRHEGKKAQADSVMHTVVQMAHVAHLDELLSVLGVDTSAGGS
ncbi:MAG TPA: DUF2723 domain-containing protein [Gemmatimonadaceae bacterium]|nr:DUF2723 domain-containing protein [Gemmatimonadaceae bacterium]